MFETLIQLKPRDEWRPGMTMEKIIEELDSKLKIPGLANVFVQPIRNRIDMLATGIKTPVGVKISGPDLATLDRLGPQVAQGGTDITGRPSAVSARITGGSPINTATDHIVGAT